MAGDDELGRALPLDITADRDDWDDEDDDERFPRPEALPWAAAWALVSAGLMAFAYTGAGLIHDALIYLEINSEFGAKSASISASAPPLVLSLLAGIAGRICLTRPDDGQRSWVRPLALAVSLLAALSALVFLVLVIVALARHLPSQTD